MRTTIYLSRESKNQLDAIQEYFKENQNDITFSPDNRSSVMQELINVFYSFFVKSNRKKSYIQRQTILKNANLKITTAKRYDNLQEGFTQIMKELHKTKVYSELGMYAAIAMLAKNEEFNWTLNDLYNINKRPNTNDIENKFIDTYMNIRD